MRFSDYVGASLIAGAAVATPMNLAKRAPAIVPSVGAFSYIGCASEASQTNSNRTLTGAVQICNSNTVESCAAFCSGYSYFGVEYGTECYCGNTLMTGYSIQSTNAQCSYACAGNSSESCGGSWFMNLYGIPKTTSTPSSTTAASSKSTSVLSVSTSSSSLISSSTSAPVPTAMTSSSVATTTTATTSSFTGAPTAVASAGGFNYVACAVEPFINGVSGQRVLTGTSTTSSSMTVEYCASFCSGYTFFGVEYASECYCGNAVQNGTTLDVGGNCNIACAANSLEQCGGSGRMNLYEVSNGPAVTLPTTYSVLATSTSSAIATSTMSSTTTTAAAITSTASSTVSSTTTTAAATTSAAATVVPSNLATVGSYVYGACVAEPFYNGVSGRTLSGYSTSNSSMTVELCSSICSGYTYFGVEYSSECYCGNSLGSGTTQDATNANCLNVCSGNAGEYCGGSGHMNLYQLASAGALNLPVTLTASTTTVSSTSAPASSTSVSTVSVSTTSSSTSSSTTSTRASSSAAPTSTVAVSTTSSSTSSSATSTKATSSAAPTSTISSSSSSAAPVTTKTSSSSSAVPTTSSATTPCTTLSTMTSSTTAATSAATTMPSSWSSTGSCQSISATTGFWPFSTTYNFSPYYQGSGYTCPTSGNLLGLLSLTKTYQFSASNTACQAAQQCISSMSSSVSLLSLLGMSKSFDLHYRTDTKVWECVTYSGSNFLTSLFSVPNSVVSYGYGFSA